MNLNKTFSAPRLLVHTLLTLSAVASNPVLATAGQDCTDNAQICDTGEICTDTGLDLDDDRTLKLCTTAGSPIEPPSGGFSWDTCGRLSEYQVAIFSRPGLAGPSTYFTGLGTWPDAFSGPNVGDNDASSLCVGPNTEVEICGKPDMHGHCQRFSTGQYPSLAGTHLGDNKASSLAVIRPGERRCEPDADEASFYIHANYRGACVTITKGRVWNLDGYLAHESVSSAILGEEVRANLKDGGLFIDEVWLDGSEPNFKNLRSEGEIVDFNDEAEHAELFDANLETPSDPRCQPGSQEVSVHVSSRYYGDCELLGPGEYSSPSEIGLQPFESIRLGSTASACVCGTVVTLAGNSTTDCIHLTSSSNDLRQSGLPAGRGNYLAVGVGESFCAAREGSSNQTSPPGFADMRIWNCRPQENSIYVWRQSLATAQVYEFIGEVSTDRVDGSCVRTSSTGLLFQLDEGLNFIRVIREDDCIDGNDPYGRCDAIDPDVIGGGSGTVEFSVD